MAVKLGRVNVDAMLRSITAKQFMEWEAYAQLEPFNELRDDYRAASIAQMVFNMAVNVKDRKPIGDFLPKWGEEEQPKKRQSWAEVVGIFRLIGLTHSVAAKES